MAASASVACAGVSIAAWELFANSFTFPSANSFAPPFPAYGVYIGKSSWKYEGWIGQLYTPSRYEYRGKVATTRFERDCLSEYAEVFKTVCVDAAYYTFPSQKYLEGLIGQVPADFQFAFKVTDEITVKKFPNLARFGNRAGQPNEHFLNAKLFADAFLRPCEPHRKNIGLLMFEFSRFYQSDYGHGREFVADLDKFLGQLPKGWPYAVEMRNKHWLQPDYFACLAGHDVTHVLNSWNAMPPRSGRAPPSLHGEWTKQQQKHKLKIMLGLTYQWSRKVIPVTVLSHGPGRVRMSKITSSSSVMFSRTWRSCSSGRNSLA
jgi:uncharacterized protein YecE (DUF72 family)